MYFLGVLCLLSVAVALPKPEQLHTDLPAIPPPPELKPENDESSEKVIVYPPGPIPEKDIEEPDKSDESKNVLESAEKSKEDNDKAQDKPDDKKVIQKDSKESKESKDSKEKSKESKEFKDSKEKSKESKEYKDSKEKSKESKESKELNDKKEIIPEEPKEEKKEKDSKSEESKERFDEDVPVIVEVIKGPKNYLHDWFSNIWDHISFHFPDMNWPFRQPEIPNDDQPIYIVKESDLDFD